MPRRSTNDPKRPAAALRAAASASPTARIREEGELLLFFTPGTPSLAALTTLEHLGWPYRVCRVQRAELDAEEFRRLNPKGQVPVLWTDDGLLTENTAVLMHLCTLGFRAGALPSPGTRQRDLFYEWLGYLDGSLRPTLESLVSIPRDDGDRRDVSEDEGRARGLVEEHLRYVDDRLEPGPYLLGEDYSVLDSYLFAVVRPSEELFDMHCVAPRLARHQERVRSQPETRFALAVERAGELSEPSPSGGYRGEVDLEPVVRNAERTGTGSHRAQPTSSPVGGVSPTP
jgi:glutathione S-transferase